jgi:transposase-like protein
MGRRKSMKELFADRHFDREVITLYVRWCLPYKLSLCDLVETMAERGLSLAHTTILRWVQRYAPRVRQALESLWSSCRPILAGQRDLRENSRPVALSLPCR